MTRAILLLSFWQIRNAVRTSLTEPRKLIPLLVIGLAFGLQLVSWMMFRGMQRPNAPEVFTIGAYMANHAAAIHALVFTFLVLGALTAIQSGFGGGALTFPLADIDYLFPAPIPRALVLAMRLPAITGRAIMMAVFGIFVMLMVFGRTLGLEIASRADGFALFAALALFVSAYVTLAIAIEVAFGTGHARLAGRTLNVLALALLAWVGLLVWRNGVDGAVIVERNWVLAALFPPSRWAANAVVAALTNRPIGWAHPGLLFAFYAPTVALTLWLARRRNFYEATLVGSERAAQLRAARQGNLMAAYALRFQRSAANRRQGRAYTLPPVGRGALALLWANLCAVGKRPILNVAAPLGLGAAISAAICVYMPRVAEGLGIVVGLDGYVSWLIVMVAARSAFQLSLQRHSLTRPLPIAPWKTVAAEVAPTVLVGSLFGWGAALPMLVRPEAIAHIFAAILLFAAPAAMSCLSLLLYTIAIWYPTGQDKLQQLLSGLVFMALMGPVLLCLTPFILIPLLLSAPPLLTVASATFGGLCVSAGLLIFSAYTLRRYEPA
ncbi:MAG TPA: putative ABC exporter domain-containing protein [Armatimonadota bacterium]